MSSGQQELIETIAQALWFPPESPYLLTAVLRLSRMPDIQTFCGLVGCEPDDLIRFPIELSNLARSSARLNRAFEQMSQPLLEADIRPERTGSFPFHSYREMFPTFVISLTALPEHHPLFGELECVVAAVLTASARLNAAVEPLCYRQFLVGFERSRLIGLPIDETLAQPGIVKLRSVSLALRGFVEHAAQLGEIDDLSRELLDKLKTKVRSFIKEPVTEARQRKSGASKPRSQGPKVDPHRDSEAILNLHAPKFEQVVEVEPDHSESDSPFLIHSVPPSVVRSALRFDMSPSELMEPEPYFFHRLHPFHSSKTSEQSARLQGKIFANHAQLLRWSTANATPRQTQKILEILQSLDAGLEVQLGNLLLLISLMTGRITESLVGRVFLGTPDDLSIGGYDDPAKQPLVLLDGKGLLFLRVNSSPVKEISGWKRAVRTESYVTVTDYLDLGDKVRSLLRLIGREVDRELIPVSPGAQLKAVSVAEVHLKPIGYPLTKIWQILPRLMQNESGQNGALALLTDWRTLNSHVELHYLCVEEQALVARYEAAATALVGSTGDFSAFKSGRKPRYVGSPNMPSDLAIRDLVTGFESALQTYTEDFNQFNLITLYTLALATAGFGLRHAIAPSIEVVRAAGLEMISWEEKGQLRQVVLPNVVSLQLAKHREMQRTFRRAIETKEGSLVSQFCLLRDNLKPEVFHPESFSKYLQRYGITYELKLNSLRRWMFSQLFMKGVRGISTDFYGGHGVFGREPLSMFSPTNFDTLIAISEDMNAILKSHWKVLSADLNT